MPREVLPLVSSAKRFSGIAKNPPPVLISSEPHTHYIVQHSQVFELWKRFQHSCVESLDEIRDSDRSRALILN